MKNLVDCKKKLLSGTKTVLKIFKVNINKCKRIFTFNGLNLSKLYKITPFSGYGIVYSVEEKGVLVCIIAFGKFVNNPEPAFCRIYYFKHI